MEGIVEEEDCLEEIMEEGCSEEMVEEVECSVEGMEEEEETGAGEEEMVEVAVEVAVVVADNTNAAIASVREIDHLYFFLSKTSSNLGN